MQLTIFSILFFLFFLCEEVKSQVLQNRSSIDQKDENLDSTSVQGVTYEKPEWKVIDVEFLSSYYEQDGNNGAVTGGMGTERLTDFTQKIIVSVPLRESFTINFDAGYDYYSSASTDNISLRSNDSASDMRTHANIGFSLQRAEQHTFGMRVGGSTEYDYNSLQAGIHYSWLSPDQNTTLGFSGQTFIDDWLIIYPRELRGEGPLVHTDKRQSYNTSLSWSQIMNKKMQFSLQLEFVLMKGLLSTPFHRVYFENQELAKVEKLPSTRLKLPVGLRWNTYLSDRLISRIYYRYYRDDWDMRAHTLSLELPYKINRFFSIYPSFRYHTQTRAAYFDEYKKHQLDQNFYTSDYDLADLRSMAFGLGMSYSPAKGIRKFRIPLIQKYMLHIDGVDLKVSHYRRSTGLTANIVSLGIKMQIR